MPFVSFFAESIKHPGQTGTFTESSKFVAKMMAHGIDGTTNVVEFGPGTGSVTLEILRRLPRNG